MSGSTFAVAIQKEGQVTIFLPFNKYLSKFKEKEICDTNYKQIEYHVP